MHTHIKSLLRGLTLGLLLVLSGAALNAQTLPPEFRVALDALSQDVGVTLDVDDLQSYQYEQFRYPTAALGCPQPDQAYAQVETLGWQFDLTYQGVTYDYRVADGGTVAILCEPEAPAQPVVPDPDPEPGILPPTAPQCANGLPYRLVIGETARTTPGLGSNVRVDPALGAAEVTTIPPGTRLTVLDGPQCGDGLAWWQVEYNQQTGWAAQGQNGLYFLEPIPQPVAAPQTLTPITAVNIPQLTELSRIEGNLLDNMAWSPTGDILAIEDASTSQPGVWLYDVTALDTVPPTRIATDFVITALAWSPDGSLLALGDDNGVVHIYDSATGAITQEIQVHPTPVNALSFNATGTLLSTLGTGSEARIWGVR